MRACRSRNGSLSLWLGDFLLYDKGTPLPFDAAAVSGWMKQNRELTVRLVFTLGIGEMHVLYVRSDV